jgi:MoaA/NifB/PqqE/SkfB family radical SAM enzyme
LSATALSNKQGILEEQARRAPVVDHLPFYYSIHLNKPCNQRCIMCVPGFNHPRDTLSLEGCQRLFEQIKPYAEHVTLIGGETLMYPWMCQGEQCPVALGHTP